MKLLSNYKALLVLPFLFSASVHAESNNQSLLGSEQVSQQEMQSYIQKLSEEDSKNQIDSQEKSVKAGNSGSQESSDAEHLSLKKVSYSVEKEHRHKLRKEHKKHKIEIVEDQESEYEKLYLDYLDDFRKIGSTKPLVKDGVVYYRYGVGQPLVICSVMYVCDIKFASDEEITGVQIGDSARWQVDVKDATDAMGQTFPHLAIKPMAENLSSNLIVFTSKRNYTITLKSITGTKYFGEVSFVYDNNNNQAVQNKLSTVYLDIPKSSQYSYRIRGDSTSWTPETVITDGKKTYIKLPESYLFSNETPTLYAIDSDGVVSQVNYRFLKNWIVVDVMLDKGELVENVGLNQEKVIFTRSHTVGILSRLFH